MHGEQRDAREQAKPVSPSTQNGMNGRSDPDPLVDDYADRSRVRIQELKKALIQRPAWRKRPRPMSAVFPESLQQGNEAIYSSIAKYIENQRKKTLVREAGAQWGARNGMSSHAHSRRALTPDAEATQCNHAVDGLARPRSVATHGTHFANHNGPTRDGRSPFVWNGSSSSRNSEMTAGLPRTRVHVKSASLGGDPSDFITPDLAPFMHKEENPTSRGLDHSGLTRPAFVSGAAQIPMKSPSLNSASHGANSESSSTISELSYTGFSRPLFESSLQDDCHSVETPSVGDSSLLSTGTANSGVSSSADSETRPESVNRSVDLEVERYTRNIPSSSVDSRSKATLDGLSRSTRHSRGVSLNNSSSSYFSLHSSGGHSAHEDSGFSRPKSSESGSSYSIGQYHVPSGTVAGTSCVGAFVRRTPKESPASSSQSNTTETIAHQGRRTRTLPAVPGSPNGGTVFNRYPWQSSDSRTRQGSRPSHQYSSHESKARETVGKVPNNGVCRPNSQRSPGEVKQRSAAQHARSHSNPVAMLSQPASPSVAGLSNPRTRAALHSEQSDRNTDESRFMSRRAERPHSVAVVERPVSRQSTSTTPRQSPFLWDCPLSKEARERRLSQSDSYGRSFCVRGITSRPLSTSTLTDSEYHSGSEGNSASESQVSGPFGREDEAPPVFTQELRQESQRLYAGVVRPRHRQFEFEQLEADSQGSSQHKTNQSKDRVGKKTVGGKSAATERLNRKQRLGNLRHGFSELDVVHSGKQRERVGQFSHSRTSLPDVVNDHRSPVMDGKPGRNARRTRTRARHSENSPESVQLAIHVARLFQEQNQMNMNIAKDDELGSEEAETDDLDEDGNPGESRDKCIEEIEQMVRELEQSSEVGLKTPEVRRRAPEVVPEEPEMEASLSSALLESEQNPNLMDARKRSKDGSANRFVENRKLDKLSKTAHSSTRSLDTAVKSGNSESDGSNVRYIIISK